MPVVAARLDEGRRGVALAVAAGEEAAGHLRSLLQTDAPCPVCGSLDHPWAERLVAPDGQVEALRARVDALDREHGALRERQAVTRATLRLAERREAELQNEATALRQRYEVLQAGWRAQPLRGLGTYEVADEGLAEALAAEQAEVATARESLAASEHAAQAALARLREVSGEKERAAEVLADALQRRNAAAAQVSRLAQRREHLDALLVRDRDAIGRARAALQPALDVLEDWPAMLERAPQELLALAAGWARRWREQAESETANKRALQREEAACVEGRESVASARAALDAQRGRSDRLEAELDGLLTERQGCLAGADVDATERAATQALEQAKTASADAATELRNAAVRRAALAQAVAGLDQQAQRERTRLAEGAADLAARLAEKGLTRAELDALLMPDEARLEAEARSLEAIEASLRQARTVLRERLDRREALETTRPARRREAVAQALQANDAARTEASDRLYGSRARLLQDDAARTRLEALEREIAGQRERTELWAALNELIGSADGRRFRAFAQSLTLEALLAHANRHLETLAPRYRLQRVPAADLDLQIVDRDMADEVRGVHSLSGGESFLVSLALALGLASLSSDRTRVESLFIDEGFGGLDPEALDVAIASLDALQSVGRRVGVISHVPALVERIGVRVEVSPQGGGRSTVTVRSG
jgi:exonuclease SbcC